MYRFRDLGVKKCRGIGNVHGVLSVPTSKSDSSVIGSTDVPTINELLRDATITWDVDLYNFYVHVHEYNIHPYVSFLSKWDNRVCWIGVILIPWLLLPRCAAFKIMYTCTDNHAHVHVPSWSYDLSTDCSNTTLASTEKELCMALQQYSWHTRCLACFSVNGSATFILCCSITKSGRDYNNNVLSIRVLFCLFWVLPTGDSRRQ